MPHPGRDGAFCAVRRNVFRITPPRSVVAGESKALKMRGVTIRRLSRPPRMSQKCRGRRFHLDVTAKRSTRVETGTVRFDASFNQMRYESGLTIRKTGPI
jgi:hypothetical protein